MKGIVKWFNPRRGYGFISGEDGTEYFAHFSAIDMDGYKTLRANQKVAFEAAKDEQGRSCAIHIQALAE